jgi:DNA polymerase III delta prime subunit
MTAMRFFNTAGPCEPDRHYMVPAAGRIPEARRLIDQGGYLVLHAPRQTGKTTTLRALARELTAEGTYAALYFSCKVAEVAGEDVEKAQRAILRQIHEAAAEDLPAELQPPDPWPDSAELTLLLTALRAWAQRCPRRLVLFFDEIDTLVGITLRNVLSQLHAGYPKRPDYFPWSVILCGLRDVRDYREAAGKDPDRFGSSSPFNIKLESIRLGNFLLDEVRALYGQHTAETGQPFTEEAVRRAFALTGGQPWLINAMAREVIEKMQVRPPAPITAGHIEEAKERLILARATHLDSLVARLSEPRVQRVIEPVLAGALLISSRYEDDVEYVRDLGLIGPGRAVEIANPIYREVIARVLAGALQRDLPIDPRSFVQADGRLDLRQMLEEFAAFWQEHGEILTSDLTYHEVAPQLVIMAYLQRVVNGGGYVAREYGLGRDRIDLLVRWPYLMGGRRQWQQEAMELKVWREKQRDPLEAGLKQLGGYLSGLGLSHGYLVIFDRRPPAAKRAGGKAAGARRPRFLNRTAPGGQKVLVLRA